MSDDAQSERETHRERMEDTQPGYPPLPPKDDSRWQLALVHPRSRNEGQLCTLPRLRLNHPLTTVYTGDQLHILPDVRFGVWLAAKVDHHIGWLNSIHLDFEAIFPADETDAAPTATQEVSAVAHGPLIESDDHFEVPTVKPEPPQPQPGLHDDETPHLASPEFIARVRALGAAEEGDEDVPLSRNDVGRIIRYLKGIAGTFKRARERTSQND